ncbi:MAG: ribosome-binding factor A [Candidatus Pelagibacter sp.]|nr:ribosome-binding factor A [Candidatus Pelagibacter sp.]OUV98061.1 MAG: ribosome-binding factor A [Candidatus Pelagibacter sp. TMED142]|tara:strand:+ start:802 stop:1173 length:372 start_codon:yes stop_codon:yes gene_type:complete
MSQNLYDQPFSQRQLKAGENLKKILAKIFLNEIIIFPTIDSKLITVTEARISPDFKYAKIFFIPLIGQRSDEFLEVLNNFSKEIKFKASKNWTAKFMPNLKFVLDESFDYAEKIEKIIKKNKE